MRLFWTGSLVRETKEEIGVKINESELIYIGTTISEDIKGNIINRHFNEFYVANLNLLKEDLTLQTEEVQDIGRFSIEELKKFIKSKSPKLTPKSCWNYLLKYFEMLDKEDEKIYNSIKFGI